MAMALGIVAALTLIRRRELAQVEPIQVTDAPALDLAA